MSVALLQPTELARFAAVCVKLEILPLSEATELALAIHGGNVAAWNERYAESEVMTSDREEIENLALDILADRLPLVGSFGPYVYNLTSDPKWEVLYAIEKKCREYLERLEREEARREENAEAYDEAPRLRTASAAEIVERCQQEGKQRVIYAQYRVSECDGQSDYYGSRTVRTVVIGFGKGKRENFSQLRKAAASFPPTKCFGPGKDRWTAYAYSEGMGNRHRGVQHPLQDERGNTMIFATEKEARDFIADLLETDINTSFRICAAHNGCDLRHESYENRENYSMGGGNYLGASRYHGWEVKSTPIEYWNSDAEIVG